MNNDEEQEIKESTPPPSEGINPEELKEIEVYLQMKKDLNLNSITQMKAYIINKDWFYKWKIKVHYYQHISKSSHIYSRNPYRRSGFVGELPSINNAELIIDPSTYLKTKDDHTFFMKSTISRSDIKFVNETVWQMLVNKYQGGPEYSITVTDQDTNYKIEDMLYYQINFMLLPLKSDIIASEESRQKSLEAIKEYTIYTKRNKTLQEMKDKLSQVIIENNLIEGNPAIEEVSDDNIRLWVIDDSIQVEVLQKLLDDKTEDIRKAADEEIDLAKQFTLQCIEEYKKDSLTYLLNDRTLINLCIERQTPNSKFIFKPINTCQIDRCSEDRCDGLMTVCCPCKEVWYCNIACYNKDKQYHERNCDKASEETIPNQRSPSSINGLCGLINMGNTCFMNTSLQCLSNCHYLTEYFISDSFKKDINLDNPLGTKGQMATVYSNLLKNMWYGTSSPVRPMAFKKSLGKYLRMFSGFQQHDTQEFLNYLLDLLHEDLNKVLKKPIVEKDDNDHPDSIKSQLHWISHLRRNQSLLVDLFWGQYKSTLICPEESCRNISITFDPFLTLSLPLVSKSKLFSIKCYFIFHDIYLTPILIDVPFYEEASFMTYRNKIAKILNIHPWSFVIVKIEDNRRIEEFMPETNPLYKPYSHALNLKYFLFQIDPKMFYSPMNKQLPRDAYETKSYEITMEYYRKYNTIRNENITHIYSVNHEEESTNPFDDSSNFGFDKTEAIGVIVKQLQSLHSNSNLDQIIFPRVVYLQKSLKMIDLYRYFFKYFYKVIQDKYNDDTIDDDSTIEENFNKRFGSEIKDEDSFNEAFLNKSIPFQLIYIQKDSQKISKIFPYEDYLLDYYVEKFLSEPEEENHHRYYYNHNQNKLFTLGVVWPNVSKEKITKTMNAMVTIDSLAGHDNNNTHHHHNQMSIYECLNRFSQKEILGANNEWYCPKCKEHRRATKKIEVYKSPNILIVHLKRFTNNTKLDTVVDFPIKDFDISKYVLAKDDENAKYDLFAIGNHYGSMGFGHYAAYGKNHEDGKWYEFNDSQVSRVREESLVSSSAYVLFYSKQNIDKVDWKKVYDKPFINYEPNESEEKDSRTQQKDTTEVEVKQSRKRVEDGEKHKKEEEEEESTPIIEQTPQEDEVPPSG